VSGGRGDDTLLEDHGLDRIRGTGGTDRFIFSDSSRDVRDETKDEQVERLVTAAVGSSAVLSVVSNISAVNGAPVFIQNRSGTLTLAGSYDLSGGVTVSNGGTLSLAPINLNPGASLLSNGTLTVNGGLTKSGSGTLILSGSSSVSGSIVSTGGLFWNGGLNSNGGLILSGGNTLAQTITIYGSGFLRGTTAGDFVWGEGGTTVSVSAGAVVKSADGVEQTLAAGESAVLTPGWSVKSSVTGTTLVIGTGGPTITVTARAVDTDGGDEGGDEPGSGSTDPTEELDPL
jgi:autotransporter-associated beta strand protein